MKKNKVYGSDNSVITVAPHEIDDSEDLAYITIYAGSGKVHINAQLIDELVLILCTVLEDYKLVELEPVKGNPTN